MIGVLISPEAVEIGLRLSEETLIVGLHSTAIVGQPPALFDGSAYLRQPGNAERLGWLDTQSIHGAVLYPPHHSLADRFYEKFPSACVEQIYPVD
jgi:hypothetical protein